uniref:Uncharacterized protein n=1 Tax=Cacopsylla melanoneura TaxID=428564 RepID=A0A8D8R7Y4_9HEMI
MQELWRRFKRIGRKRSDAVYEPLDETPEEATVAPVDALTFSEKKKTIDKLQYQKFNLGSINEEDENEDAVFELIRLPEIKKKTIIDRLQDQRPETRRRMLPWFENYHQERASDQ